MSPRIHPPPRWVLEGGRAFFFLDVFPIVECIQVDTAVAVLELIHGLVDDRSKDVVPMREDKVLRLL